MSERTADRPPRQTRQERKLATRTRLLEAAAQLVAQHGLAGVSVEDVAHNAGYTVGAVYANFSGKDDLLASVLDEQVQSNLEELRDVLEGDADPGDRIRQLGDFLNTRSRRHRARCTLAYEFWPYAYRDPKLRRRLARRWRVARAGVASLLDDEVERQGYRLTVEPVMLASLIEALVDGLMMQTLLDPAGTPADAFERGLTLLLAGATRPADPHGSLPAKER